MRSVAADAGGADRIGLDGDGAHRGMGQHPFDADRAGAGADVPQQFAAPWRQRRQGDGADFALGDLAVMLEQMIGKADVSGRMRACGVDSISMRQHVERIDVFRSKASARAERSFSFGPPSASRTVSREAPKSSSVSRRAIAAGASPSDVSARMRAFGCSSGRIRSSGRPCSETVSISCSAQPSRAAASEMADGAGMTCISCGSTLRARVAPTPWKNGSPEASTQTFLPASASTSRISASKGIGQGRASPLAKRCDKGEVPLAAEDEFGLGDQPLGLVAETR